MPGRRFPARGVKCSLGDGQFLSENQKLRFAFRSVSLGQKRKFLAKKLTYLHPQHRVFIFPFQFLNAFIFIFVNFEFAMIQTEFHGFMNQALGRRLGTVFAGKGHTEVSENSFIDSFANCR